MTGNIGDLLFFNRTIDEYNTIGRLLAALLAGGIIGFQREQSNQPAGLRTHMLITVGSALMMMLSVYLPQNFDYLKNGDPGRIAAQVVSGIGFLGAGAIIRFGSSIKGLTTAATIWTTAGIGLAIGAGMIGEALIAVLIVFFILSGVEILEQRYFSRRIIKTIIIDTDNGLQSLDSLCSFIKTYNINIIDRNFSINYCNQTATITLMVRTSRKSLTHLLADEITQIGGVRAIKIDDLK